MSMIGNLVRVSEETVSKLHANPDLILEMLYPGIIEAAKPRVSFLGRLFGKQPVSVEPNQTVSAIPESDTLDIDKSWHAIHYLLTGSGWEGQFPGGFLSSELCGETVGNVDVGYGPARSFSVNEAAMIADFLADQSDELLRSRLNFAEMKELGIYPSVWDDESTINDEWDYIQYFLKSLRPFLAETKSRKMGLLVYIN